MWVSGGCDLTPRQPGSETMYEIHYSNHDSGSKTCGTMVRETLHQAERTLHLLSECGYRAVTITKLA
jgi:hypothetical protein